MHKKKKVQPRDKISIHMNSDTFLMMLVLVRKIFYPDLNS